MKALRWIVPLVLAAACIYLWIDRDDLKGRYKELQAQSAARELEHKAAVERIALLETDVARRDSRIADLEGIIVQNVGRIRFLEGELADIQDAEPDQPELENEPLVINLRLQVAKLTEMFSLSQRTVAAQAEEILELRGKCLSLEAMGAEWKAEYDKEHALRLTAEDLVKDKVRQSKKKLLFWKGVAIGGTAYGLLK